MADPVIVVSNVETGNRARFPIVTGDTVEIVLRELCQQGFLTAPADSYSITLQPVGRQVNLDEVVSTLNTATDCRLDFSNRGASLADQRPAPPNPSGARLPAAALNEQQTPCILALDCSYSMSAFGKIDALNAALEVFSTHVRENSNTRYRVTIQVITFSTTVQKISEWTAGSNFVPPKLIADGNQTPLGEAVTLALDEIEQIKSQYRREGRTFTRPIMILMTDGLPTSDWEPAARAARAAIDLKKVQIWPVAILPLDQSQSNDGANIDVLRQFKRQEDILMTISTTQNFREFFEFLYRALEIKSISAPGDESLRVPLHEDRKDSPMIGIMN